MITETHEPVRPLRAPDDGSAYGGRVILSRFWRVHYGLSDWPTRGYLLIALNGFNSTE